MIIKPKDNIIHKKLTLNRLSRKSLPDDISAITPAIFKQNSTHKCTFRWNVERGFKAVVYLECEVYRSLSALICDQ